MRKTLGEQVATYAGRHVERYAWAGCAVAAWGFALVSDVGPHRVWGWVAGTGYALAAGLAPGPNSALGMGDSGPRGVRAPGRRGGERAVAWRSCASRAVTWPGSGRLYAARAGAVVGAVVVPLVGLVVTGLGQSEVAVVERSGRLLLTTGNPYIGSPAAVADFNPYLPGMALFGVPPGDARWWLGGAFVACLGAVGLCRARLIACPFIALPLAVGGVDLPVAGLMCLGVSLAGRGRPGRAGLALGTAAALKWTAWPALPVALALVAVRQGRRSASRCAAVALTAATAAALPFALACPADFCRNVVAFPLGLTATASPAGSPLPGRLLAAHVPGGELIAVALLAIGALLVGLSLVARPPRTGRAAALRLALGLILATALMPATRFGYLVYPLVLAALAYGTPDRAGCAAPTPAPEGSPV